jgi:carbon-monoxide dehydrogenase large subunit
MFLADEQARDVLHKGELALDADGRILGMRFEFVCNLGAYLAFTGAFVNTVNLVNVASGVYDVQAVHVHASLVFTNTVPTAAYRGAGRPVSSYAIECLVDAAACAIGMDPAEFRRRNLVPKEEFPYRIVTGFEYDCGDFAGALDQALAAADWNGFEARRASAAVRGRLLGRGISTYIEMTVFGTKFMTAAGVDHGNHDAAIVRMDPGGGVTLSVGTLSHGQGHQTPDREPQRSSSAGRECPSVRRGALPERPLRPDPGGAPTGCDPITGLQGRR